MEVCLVAAWNSNLNHVLYLPEKSPQLTRAHALVCVLGMCTYVYGKVVRKNRQVAPVPPDRWDLICSKVSLG